MKKVRVLGHVKGDGVVRNNSDHKTSRPPTQAESLNLKQVLNKFFINFPFMKALSTPEYRCSVLSEIMIISPHF